MRPLKMRTFLGPVMITSSLALWLAAGQAAHAQDSGEDQSGSGTYQTNETDSTNDNIGSSVDTNQFANASEAGPVRLARFSYIKGDVVWRGDESLEWSPATTNLPVRQGAQIWVTNGGRAELQFDDGSVIRLGNKALLTLKTLYSDAQGEFTQLVLNNGIATLLTRNDHSIYQVDTPFISMKTATPSRIRIGAGSAVEVAVQSGQATLEGAQGSVTLGEGDYIDLGDANASYEVRRLPSEDSWDEWNDTEDQVLTVETSRPSYSYVPSNIGLVAGDLDTYGSWRDDATYGHVWCPRTAAADWRPYHDGHWTWVAPFGWTWVADEPWGWAPYHYGTWVHASYGWGWCPGPAQQYWCPAVVNFSEYDGNVAWCPLAPTEVRYPSALSIGFRSGNWSLFFSIGQAGCYYPNSGGGYCLGRPYSNTYVNHVTYVNNVTNITNIYNNGSPRYNRYLLTAEASAAQRRSYLENNRFVPVNARYASGVTTATVAAFGGRGQYSTLERGNLSIFQRGRTAAPPSLGRPLVAGPISVRPTLQALTPDRTLLNSVQLPNAVLRRPTYHAAVPSSVRQGIAQAARQSSLNGVQLADMNGRQHPSNTSTGSGFAASRPLQGRDPVGSITVQRNDAGRPGGASNVPDVVLRARGQSQPQRTDRMGVRNYSSVLNWTGARSGADAAARARASLHLPAEIGGRNNSDNSVTHINRSDMSERRPGNGSNPRAFSPAGEPRIGGLRSGTDLQVRPAAGNRYPDANRDGAPVNRTFHGVVRPDIQRQSDSLYGRPRSADHGNSDAAGPVNRRDNVDRTQVYRPQTRFHDDTETVNRPNQRPVNQPFNGGNRAPRDYAPSQAQTPQPGVEHREPPTGRPAAPSNPQPRHEAPPRSGSDSENSDHNRTKRP